MRRHGPRGSGSPRTGGGPTPAGSGPSSFVDPAIMSETERFYAGLAPLYHLVYATKNRLGNAIWQSVAQIDARGQRSLFPV